MTFAIAGRFDEIIVTRSGLILFILQPKRTERNKQFVMSENTKVTKKTKAKKPDLSWASAEIFPGGGNLDILFIIFKLLTISVPSKMILHEQIFVLVSMII